MRLPSLLLISFVAVVPSSARAQAPGGVEVSCDVERRAFAHAIRGQSDVVFRLWDHAEAGVQCGADYHVALDRVVLLKAYTPGRTRGVMRLSTVLGSDQVPFALCADVSGWLEAQVGEETFDCDASSASRRHRRELSSAPFAVTVKNDSSVSAAASTGTAGLFDVRAYGAVGDGLVDDTAAILTAKAAADPICGQLYFPPGTYLTTGLVFADSCVSLVGAGGTSDVLSARPDFQKVASKLKSVTNAPVITYTMSVRHNGADAGRWAIIRDLGILGAATAGPNQHCIQVDNRGVTLVNVTATYCGGHGFYFTDSVATKGYNLHAWRNTGDGFHFDDASTVAGDGSVNFNSFFGGASVSNGGNGVTVVHGTGEIFDGFDFEANAGWGIDLRGAGGERPASGCRFSSTWDEANLGGSVLFEAGSRYNVVDFLRYSSGSPNDGGLGNVVWGVDARGDSPALVHQFAGFGLNRYVDRMSGSNVALDFGVGSFLELTLTGNVTGGTTFAHVKDGQIIVLALLQDAAGNRTFTWPTNVHCSGGCPALSAAPHARDVFTFYFDGSSFWEVARSVDLL